MPDEDGTLLHLLELAQVAGAKIVIGGVRVHGCTMRLIRARVKRLNCNSLGYSGRCPSRPVVKPRFR